MKPGVIRLYEFKVKRRRLPGVLTDYQNKRTKPEHIAEIFRLTFSGEPREHFVTFHLDLRAAIVGYELVSIGGAESVEVHPREVFRGALLAGATAMILCHNHPSGVADPSDNDDELTERLWSAGKILGIFAVDHIIVTDTTHYSYHEHQRFPWAPDHA